LQLEKRLEGNVRFGSDTCNAKGQVRIAPNADTNSTLQLERYSTQIFTLHQTTMNSVER